MIIMPVKKKKKQSKGKYTNTYSANGACGLINENHPRRKESNNVMKIK